ncbi:UDP-N-acetylmuramate dehydrogenase [Pseudomonas stutzeri]|uniref:UDP-N-acetylmuramate dehydrogenase n=1 Tax=Stutzerimonas stutzeri TaxID=316 RepID=UPI002109331B|nr:UDP-N-acetylmuramate dehydrogenase [Stutzerimonas stutzeri]MCQ4306543.1 UDP-N-acetylmuramate dehydrogenase [Stutzerimonas stutzeri]
MTTVMRLRQLIEGTVSEHVPLSTISRWKIGGSADLVIEPSSLQEVIRVVDLLRSEAIPYAIVGSTSNILFSDKEINAAIIKFGKNLSSINYDSEKKIISCDAGCWMPRLARMGLSLGCSDFEHLVGIPGTVGGGVVMNAGSKQQSISETLDHVIALGSDNKLHRLEPSDCEFDYRHSCFQSGEFIVLRAFFRPINTDTKRKIRARMLSTLAERRRKFPIKLPNCGSVFKADKTQYSKYGAPGRVIENLGLKDTVCGGATVSSTHANFIINKDKATAVDVIRLASFIKNKVEAEVEYKMESEIKYCTEFGVFVPLHEAFKWLSE